MSIYYLKKKVDILSIDIYLNKRIVDFERKLIESEITKLINNSNTTITIYLYNKHPYRYLKKMHLEIESTKIEWINK